MTWLELYNFLHQQANNIHNHGNFDWQSNVEIYDAETGSLTDCDTYFLTDDTNADIRFVLMTHLEKV